MWINPVTNRSDEDTKTNYTDINRIFNNINVLADSNLKTDWTANDILDKTSWKNAIDTLNEIIDNIVNITGDQIEHATYELKFDNLNDIEAKINQIHEYGTLCYYYDFNNEAYLRNYIPSSPNPGDVFIWGTLENKIYECGFERKYFANQGGWISTGRVSNSWQVIAHKKYVDYQFKNPIAGKYIRDMSTCFVCEGLDTGSQYENIDSIIIPSTIRIAQTAFYGTNIETVPILPNGLKDGQFMFQRCNNLKTCSRLPSSLKQAYGMFNGCSNLEGEIAFHLDDDEQYIEDNFHGMFKNTVKPITITDVNVDKIDVYNDYIKADCTNITIQIPEEEDE